jgi:CRP-like cAMP-binding protein
MPSLFQPRKRARELQLAHALRTVPLFRDLPAGDLLDLWRRLHILEAPAGTVLCQRGEPGDRFYVLQSGSAEVRLGLDPDGVILRLVAPGDFVGEMALLTGQPRTADVVVAEDATLWALDRADFTAILAGSIPLLHALNRVLCEHVTRMTLMVEESAASGRLGMVGRRIGPYRVLAQLGAGGMAAVYQAVHISSDATVALKVLPVAWGAADEFRMRLVREAAALQQIDHPNVVTLFEVGELEAGLGGGCYLAMAWIPHALDRLLWAQYPEPLRVDQALHLAQGVAEGLAAVHAAELVHRDVKPSNILLREDGAPVLIDFGLVALLAAEHHDRRLTDSNVIVGTADYMAPEQAAGLPLDGRADLYALGVVLYEMLAGYVPFAGRDPLATLQAHVAEPPPPLPASVPPDARVIVEQALQKRADDRFPSAAAMARAIAAARGD